ncbi:alpha/beta hydrolase-fold protein [Flammeovirga kamogawensis]|uniref:Alpha/beta hydrolase n=1 Tax=Flammeovirga kamogawensis TaxID=373891 RepID=A0ABX8GT45_9BACT|nr:alpha/beta hydrolase-fold protein [Flammeovirga kamogawensis]MBB6462498.1 putative alpha/beta superfamily hydrolase [Flammeovirga kamogawensis]QWG06765.1 alpha/beta hydrolase [Flammeovirga kamogawensis]
MYKLVTIAFLLSLISCIKQRDEIDVTWNINLEKPVDKQIYISGNQPFLGNWSPKSILLEKNDSLHWSFTNTVSKNTLLEYKFTLGDWNFQAANENGIALENMEVITPKKDTIINVNIKNWTSGNQLQEQGQITGTVEYIKDFHIDGLKDRDIIIWLPPSYKTNQTKRYPVLYMHDGQNTIDPRTSSFGVDWQVDETVTNLIENKKLQEIIIVASYCTEDRNADYGDTKKGKLYRKSLAIDLKKYIDIKYRTKPQKQHTAIAGSSMGGLVSFMSAWEYPEVYKGAICMSPAFKYEDFDYINTITEDNKKDLILYIDNGGKGVDIILQPGVEKMEKELLKKGYKLNDDLFVVFNKKAKHSEGDWALRFPYAIELFFKK